MPHKIVRTILCSLGLLLGSCTHEPAATAPEPSKTPSDTTQPTPADAPTPTAAAHWDIHDLFKSENSTVVNLMADNQFAAAAKTAKRFLENEPGRLTEPQRANMRYMHIFANAALAYEGKTKNSDVSKLAEGYIGEWLTTQHLPITDQQGQPFNQIEVRQEEPDSIIISCAQDQGLGIYCFIHMGIKPRPDLKSLMGKSAYLHGRLAKVRAHDDESNIWIIALYLAEGELHVLDDEF